MNAAPGDRIRSRTPLVAALAALWPALAAAQAPATIPVNRAWDVLPEPSSREAWRDTMAMAGSLLGEWPISFAGVPIDGATLEQLATTRPEVPFTRVVREELRRPVDVEDFLFFLDDVLRAGEGGRRGEMVWLSAGRARAAGILLHPDDVFFADPRLYADGWDDLAIDRPVPPSKLPPPTDGEPLGPAWSLRYPNPGGEAAMLEALARTNRHGLAARVASLLAQLRAQGCEVQLAATMRNRTRGYLMWGAFALARIDNEESLRRFVKKLDRHNAAWRLRVPIAWSHPGGWEATVEAARQMADAYDVVFATEGGARRSKHYDGLAFDVTAMGLPVELTLEAPDGARRTFDLSDEDQSRDLNLTPALVTWIEEHFALEKLKSDHPHWNDVRGKR